LFKAKTFKRVESDYDPLNVVGALVPLEDSSVIVVDQDSLATGLEGKVLKDYGDGYYSVEFEDKGTILLRSDQIDLLEDDEDAVSYTSEDPDCILVGEKVPLSGDFVFIVDDKGFVTNTKGLVIGGLNKGWYSVVTGNKKKILRADQLERIDVEEDDLYFDVGLGFVGVVFKLVVGVMAVLAVLSITVVSYLSSISTDFSRTPLFLKVAIVLGVPILGAVAVYQYKKAKIRRGHLW
jgi:hypothetical protein